MTVFDGHIFTGLIVTGLEKLTAVNRESRC